MKSVVYLQLLKCNDHPLNGIDSLFSSHWIQPSHIHNLFHPITSIHISRQWCLFDDTLSSSLSQHFYNNHYTIQITSISTTTTQPEQHDHPYSFQPTNTIHKPKLNTSISPRSRNSIRFSLRSPHLNEFPFQNSLAQSLPTLLCPRYPPPLFLVSFLTSYAFQSHCVNTRTTITIPFQSLLQHKSFQWMNDALWVSILAKRNLV